MGGFESASMLLDTGRRVDVIDATRHDRHAKDDYELLASAGITTVRDALRWHLIEASPRRYEWSSAFDQVRAARQAGVQVIWDLAHFGFPGWLDPWSSDFPLRFGAYARAAAELISSELGRGGVWSCINEMSYWAFAGGDQGHFAPLGRQRGDEWKRQLVRASVLACAQIREVDPSATFLQPEPAIHIAAASPSDTLLAQAQTAAMFEAWDMISGIAHPDLGGSPNYLNYIGVNFYSNNQWMSDGRRLGMGDLGYQPFSEIILNIWRRYNRPIVVTETGAEGDNFRGWMRYVAGEVKDAIAHGAEVAGVCIYPISDYPGWTDDRYCPCGLIALSPTSSRKLREQHLPMLQEAFGSVWPTTDDLRRYG